MRVFIDGYELTDYVSMGLNCTNRKDDNLDEGSFVVAPLLREKPFDPGSIIFIGDEQYVLSGDSVSVCGRGSNVSYKHEIHYAQLTRALCFVTIRGTDLRQPAMNPHERGYARRIYGPNSSLDSFDSNAFDFGTETLDGATLSVRVFYSDKDYSYEHTSSTHNAISNLHETTAWTGSITVTDGTQVRVINRSSMSKRIGEEGVSVSLGALSSEGGSLKINDISVSISEAHDFLFVDAYIEGDTHRYSYKDAIRETIKAHYSKAIEQQYIRFVESDSIYDRKAPDFSFQQGTTLYDALKEIFDALGMKMKARYNQGYIEIYGSRYDEKGDSVTPTITSEELDMSDGSRNQSAEVSYQSAITDNACYAPAYGTATKAKSKKLGVPDQSSWHIITQQPIHAILKVFAYTSSDKRVYTTYDFTEDNVTYKLYVKFPANFPIDVTDYVYEREEQSLLTVSAWATEYISATQGNTITWQRGQRDIYVGAIERTPINTAHYAMENLIKGATYRMFGGILVMTGASPFDVAFNVKYIPQATGAFEAECVDEKLYRGYKGKLPVKQSSSLNGITRLGDNVFGSVSRSGWGDKSITIGFKSDSDIPHIGDFYHDDDGEWEISTLDRVKLPNGWQCAISLTKNFNRLAQRTKIDREIRQTEISPKLALESTNVYKEYLYVSKPHQTGGRTTLSRRNIIYSLVAGIRSLDQTPAVSGFVVNTLDKHSDLIARAYMPITVYQAGNALCFEGGFESAMSAGYKTEVANNWVTSYISKPIIYADASGEARWMTVYAMGAKGIIDDYASVSESNALFSIENIYCNKHANEVLRFNYEVVALANDDMVVYPRLLRYAINEFRADCRVITRETPFSQFEGVLSGGEALSYASSDYDTDNEIATITLNNMCPSHHCWCIVDKDGYPLIACNEDDESRPVAFSMNVANERVTHPNIICKVTLSHVKSVTFSNGNVITKSGYARLPYGSVGWEAVAEDGYSLSTSSGTINTALPYHYVELSISAS